MIKERTIVSVETPGSYHKTVAVEHLGSYDGGYARFVVRCSGHTVGNAFFNLSVPGAKELRDALISLFPLKPKFTRIDAAPKGAQEYKGNGKHEWERVEKDGVTDRLRVPGGWLYRDGFHNTVSFVPMPDVVGYKI